MAVEGFWDPTRRGNENAKSLNRHIRAGKVMIPEPRKVFQREQLRRVTKS